MSLYSVIKPVLFALSAERSHDLSLQGLCLAERLGILSPISKHYHAPVQCMGLTFPNPVGLAAGLDKNGEVFNALAAWGFGFIEIGTVTPRAQPGNPQPRLFRLADHEAIINRMGFNNKGVDHLVEQVKQRRFEGILGINIGKNKATPDEKAADDYLYCLDRVYDHADYIAVNISSPNTPGLRGLQFGEALSRLLEAIKTRQKTLHEQSGRYVPIAVKIAPDMTDEQICETAETLLQQGIDGVIATNTTVAREQIAGDELAEEAGGLSGRPVFESSTHVLSVLVSAIDGKLPMIGVGGISSAEDAALKREAGADLVQVYSGLIYKGPGLVGEAVKGFTQLGVDR